jgi:hypothetical protein
LLITLSPHIVVILNELDNLHGLDAILNGKPIRLGNHASRQCGSNIGEMVLEEVDHNTKVKWFLPLDASYVSSKVALILYLKSIFMIDLWGNMGK